MRANAGIGILRNATEVLKTKEGVCRDFAILGAALMRASGIPTRIASGAFGWDGRFYYHAWVEVLDGKRWVGLDPTRPERDLSATHLTLRRGTAEDAFTYPVLDGARAKVLEVRY
jgi:hypothetical protein